MLAAGLLAACRRGRRAVQGPACRRTASGSRSWAAGRPGSWHRPTRRFGSPPAGARRTPSPPPRCPADATTTGCSRSPGRGRRPRSCGCCTRSGEGSRHWRSRATPRPPWSGPPTRRSCSTSPTNSRWCRPGSPPPRSPCSGRALGQDLEPVIAQAEPGGGGRSARRPARADTVHVPGLRLDRRARERGGAQAARGLLGVGGVLSGHGVPARPDQHHRRAERGVVPRRSPGVPARGGRGDRRARAHPHRGPDGGAGEGAAADRRPRRGQGARPGPATQPQPIGDPSISSRARRSPCPPPTASRPSTSVGRRSRGRWSTATARSGPDCAGRRHPTPRTRRGPDRDPGHGRRAHGGSAGGRRRARRSGWWSPASSTSGVGWPSTRRTSAGGTCPSGPWSSRRPGCRSASATTSGPAPWPSGALAPAGGSRTWCSSRSARASRPGSSSRDGSLTGGGYAGEIGHVDVGHGEPCTCGGRGCVEAVASAAAIARRYAAVSGRPVPGARDVAERMAPATRPPGGSGPTPPRRWRWRSPGPPSSSRRRRSSSAEGWPGRAACSSSRSARPWIATSAWSGGRGCCRPPCGTTPASSAPPCWPGRCSSQRRRRHDPDRHAQRRARHHLPGRPAHPGTRAIACGGCEERAGGKGVNVARVSPRAGPRHLSSGWSAARPPAPSRPISPAAGSPTSSSRSRARRRRSVAVVDSSNGGRRSSTSRVLASPPRAGTTSKPGSPPGFRRRRRWSSPGACPPTPTTTPAPGSCAWPPRIGSRSWSTPSVRRSSRPPRPGPTS